MSLGSWELGLGFKSRQVVPGDPALCSPLRVCRPTWELPLPGQALEPWVSTPGAHRGALDTTGARGPPQSSDVIALGV